MAPRIAPYPLHLTTLQGAQAVATLNGLVTNDVTRLTDGTGQYAAALTPRGKVLADLFVLRLHAESLLVGVPVAAAAGWWAMLRKYVNPRFARYADVSAEQVALLLLGAETPHWLTQQGLGAVPETEWATWAHAPVALPAARPEASPDASSEAGTARVVRLPDHGPGDAPEPAWLLLVPAPSATAVQATLIAAGATPMAAEAVEVARVEAGVLRWGVDLDDRCLAQEADLDDRGAISFEKGCYTGQETVARVHFRGHVNRHLRGLRADGPLHLGQVVLDAAGAVVGDVRSAVVSPTLGPIALAMVRREVVPGAVVRVVEVADPAAPPDAATRPAGPGLAATVVTLPFRRS